MVLLEVVTRCYKRPVMLAKNMASLQGLLACGWAQTFLVDRVGIGCAAANAQMAEFTPHGAYVWLLDDDDECIDHRLVIDLQRIVEEHHFPPAVMVRMDHGQLGILPGDNTWRQVPQLACIGVSAIITRRDVWMAHRQAWRSARYESDFDFISAVYATHAADIVWHDTVASRVQRRSIGAPENA